MKNLRRLCSVTMLTLIMFLSVARVSTSAATVNVTREELKYFVAIKDTSIHRYHSVKIYLNKRYISTPAYLIMDTTYIPLRAVSEMAGATVSFDSVSRTAFVKMAGLDMSVSDGSFIIYANGRPIASRTPSVILSDGRMYVPIRSVAKALSLEVSWLPSREVMLSGTPIPLAPASEFYDADELYWLSRIISAEAQGEPLLGQIAVGNVVLNRVRSRDFPSTIYGVIFDRKHGVQFSPIANGSIYKTPTYTATVAAKICLEGFTVSEDILFFMEPTKSTSSWIANNRKYAFTIENHNFYY